MELSEDIFKTIDDEISDQEALESIADYSVSSTTTWTLKREKALNFFNQNLNKYFKTG